MARYERCNIQAYTSVNIAIFKILPMIYRDNSPAQNCPKQGGASEQYKNFRFIQFMNTSLQRNSLVSSDFFQKVFSRSRVWSLFESLLLMMRFEWRSNNPQTDDRGIFIHVKNARPQQPKTALSLMSKVSYFYRRWKRVKRMSKLSETNEYEYVSISHRRVLIDTYTSIIMELRAQERYEWPPTSRREKKFTP